jgi:uncharacterized protein (DUF1778 family)
VSVRLSTVPPMPRTGRPPSDNPRTKMVNVRLTEDEYMCLFPAAQAAGVTISEYVRSHALAAARKQHRRANPGLAR